MSKNAITTIPFHGANILVSAGDTPETTMVAMKPVVEGMGLDWSYQSRKLNEHPVLSKGVAIIAIPSSGGVQDALALPLNRLHFWLATLQPNKIKDTDVRDRVIVYQTEAADVLFDHFFGSKFEQEPNGLTPYDARIIGNIVKNCTGVVVREELSHVLPSLIDNMVSARLAQQNILLRHGKTAKDIWDAAGLPPKLRGATVWFGNRLKEMGASIENDGKYDRGNVAVRLFDPDKASVFMKNGLLHKAKVYASERMGQGKLRLIGDKA